MLPTLSLLETRVLGVLVEKQHTVPDSYPLTLNALVSGCNQKNARDPVMEASDTEVQEALDRLKTLSLAIESSGGRVMRYAQNAGKVFGLPPQSVALLAVLFLRGPQTAGELRINSERLHKFGDILAVQGFLDELADKGFVKELPRQPGARETRWTHLLGDAHLGLESPEATPQRDSAGGSVPHADAALEGRIERLEAELAELKEKVARLYGEHDRGE